jgi:exosome complex component RRP41
LGLLEQASLFVDITMSPFSTNEHKKRAKNDKRMVEMATAVRQTFEPVVLPHINTRSGINIYLQILQHDGGKLYDSNIYGAY